LKKILSAPANSDSEAKEERRLQILEVYRTTPFVDLVAQSEKNTTAFADTLNNILAKIPAMTEVSPSSPPEAEAAAAESAGIKKSSDETTDSSDGHHVKRKESTSDKNPFADLGMSSSSSSKRPPLFAVQFPDLFVY